MNKARKAWYKIMAIFDGEYSWDGKKTDSRDPITWFPGAYDLKIVKRSNQSFNVEELKPYICVYSSTGKGASISANPEKFAKTICEDFGLEIERVLWVEDHKNAVNRFEVILYTKMTIMKDTFFYKIQKRPPSEKELLVLEKEMGELLSY